MSRGCVGCLTIAMLVFGVPMLVGGIVVSVKGKRELEESRVIAGWPTTPGVVRSVQVAARTSESTRTVRRKGLKQTEKVLTKHYAPRITYAYSVSGRDHLGADWGPGDEAWTSEASAKQALERTPVGSAVKVWVNPADPTESYLDPGEQLSAVLMFVGIAMAVLGAILDAVAASLLISRRKAAAATPQATV